MNSNNDILPDAKSVKDMSSATTDYSIRINDLIDNMSVLEKKIINETEIIKEYYHKASSAMKETQNYFLNGIMLASPPSRITCEGIEVQDDEVLFQLIRS